MGITLTAEPGEGFADLSWAEVSTFRADLVAHLMAVANTYRTANPTLLRRVWSARPGGFGEAPLLYIGARSETSPDDNAQTYTRHMSVEVVAVDTYADNEQTTDRMDVLVDGLKTAYEALVNTNVALGIMDHVDVLPDSDIGVTNPATGVTVWYRSTTFVVAAHVQEGRS